MSRVAKDQRRRGRFFVISTRPRVCPTFYLETMPMKELTTEYVTARLMHEMSKRKEKEPQGEEVALVSRQSKGGDPRLRQGVKTCFYCGKPGHIARFC